MLGILERKGYVAHRTVGRTFVYRPVVDREAVRHRVVDDVVSRFFDDSPKFAGAEAAGPSAIGVASYGVIVASPRVDDGWVTAAACFAGATWFAPETESAGSCARSSSRVGSRRNGLPGAGPRCSFPPRRSHSPRGNARARCAAAQTICVARRARRDRRGRDRRAAARRAPRRPPQTHARGRVAGRPGRCVRRGRRRPARGAAGGSAAMERGVGRRRAPRPPRARRPDETHAAGVARRLPVPVTTSGSATRARGPRPDRHGHPVPLYRRAQFHRVGSGGVRKSLQKVSG